MKAYARRLSKFLVFLVALFFIMLFLLPWLTRGISFEQTYNILLFSKKMRMVLSILFVYAFVYPLINFGRKDRYISGTFEDNRVVFEKVMEKLDYIKKSEEASLLVFRRKSAFPRIIMWGEDRVEIDIARKPILLSGPKKDLKRIEMALDIELLGKKV
jgi:hypothetical protein